jgi:hypothetical protein
MSDFYFLYDSKILLPALMLAILKKGKSENTIGYRNLNFVLNAKQIDVVLQSLYHVGCDFISKGSGGLMVKVSATQPRDHVSSYDASILVGSRKRTRKKINISFKNLFRNRVDKYVHNST